METVTTRLPGCETRAIASLALFVAVQVADAMMTTSGLARFGPTIEANPILSFSIALYGATGTLVAAKLVAVACATALHVRSHHLSLAVLTVGYVFVAVLPWSWALTQ